MCYLCDVLWEALATPPGGATPENLTMDAGDLEALQSAATVTGQVSSWQVANSRMRLKVGS